MAWIAERALPGLSAEDAEALREMVASVDRARDRIEEESSARRRVAAVILAEACQRVIRLPVVALGSGNG